MPNLQQIVTLKETCGQPGNFEYTLDEIDDLYGKIKDLDHTAA